MPIFIKIPNIVPPCLWYKLGTVLVIMTLNFMAHWKMLQIIYWVYEYVAGVEFIWYIFGTIVTAPY